MNIYDEENGFSDKATLEEIKIFMAKKVKTYNDAIIKANEAEMRLSKATDIVNRERQELSRMWTSKRSWLMKDIRERS